MGTEQGKGNLLMILLQAINLRGIALHGGADAHHSYTNSEGINQVENRLQPYISKIYYKYLDYSRRQNYTTRRNEPINTIFFLIIGLLTTFHFLKENYCL